MMVDRYVMCDVGAQAVEETFRDANITMTEYIQPPRDVTDRELEDYLRRLRNRAMGMSYKLLRRY